MKSNSLLIMFFAFLLVVIGGGLFILLNKDTVDTAFSTSNVSDKQENTPIIVSNEEEEETPDYLAPEGFKYYSNPDLKFTLYYPIKSYNFNGGCKQVNENGITTYRPVPEEIPVKIFETENGVYIDFEYMKILGDPTAVDGVSYFDSCVKQNKTAELLQTDSSRRTWHIIAEKVKNTEELKQFIRSRFGPGCDLGTMTATVENNKVYDVQVKGDGLDMGETQCPINYMFVLKYVPTTGFVYTYDLGQAYTFAKNADGSEAYDMEMKDSFQPIL